MKTPLESERIIKEDWKIKNFDKSVPIFAIKPRNNDYKKLLICIPGLNGGGSMIKFFDNQYFEDYFFFSFDARAQGHNKNSASRFYKKYINDIFHLINEIKKRYKSIEEIYLCGESWGSTLAILVYKKYPKLINGVIGWNMPFNVVDTSKEKGWEKIKKSSKVLLTFLTSISTYDDSPFVTELTNNKALIKIAQTMRNNKLNNKLPLAAWRSFKKAWKVLEKDNNLNILYIQSLEDIMFSKKRLDKIKNNKKIVIFEKGYHILSFDKNVNNELFKKIKYFIG